MTDFKAWLAAQLPRVEALQERRPWRTCSRTSRGRSVRGTQRRDFRKAWAGACKAAVVPVMLRHDFRSTAVRNMERTGVSRSVATKITGHKTEAVYRRYAIVSDADLRAAAVLLADGYNHGDSKAREVDVGPLSM
jgi:integrase